MPSTLTWLDTSEADRRQALEVIDAFRDRDTRDELGLGTIRDGLSDILFPGTTTIQTRARYFLFIPWIYRALESTKVSSSQIARRARAQEISLIEPLRAEGQDGVIGINAGADLKRLPSAIYWQGLGAWGVRRFEGSQDQYHRSLDAFYRRTSDSRRNDDLEFFDAPGANWDPALPAPPSDFPAVASLRFRAEEQEYLRDRILQRYPASFLAYLVRRDVWEPVAFAWEHPAYGAAPSGNRHQLHHARSFSELIHGAQLLYNLLLAEARSSEELVDDYRGRLEIWQAEIDARWDVLAHWIHQELPDFWNLVSGARVAGAARVFVEKFLSRIITTRPGSIADDGEARDLVQGREVFLKRRLARLTNATSLGNWGGAAGASQLDMRWPISQRLLLDILAPVDEPDA